MYLGAQRGLETKLLEKIDLPLELRTLEICGLSRPRGMGRIIPSIGHNVLAIWKFVLATQVAKKHLAAWEPEVLIGTGGYVSAPAIYAAHALQIPVLLHEQNTHPGLTIRLLSRYAQAVAISWEETRRFFPRVRKVVLTGNPRATEVIDANAAEGRRKLRLPGSASPLVVFVGGSQGSLRINQSVQSLLPRCKERFGVNFVYITGDRYHEKAKRCWEEVGSPSNIAVVPYVHHMPDLLAATSLVVARAGATTLAEVTSLGLPSILIPSPIAANDHQMTNARLLERGGAALVVPDAECTADRLWTLMEEVLGEPARQKAMRQASKALGHPYAAIAVMDLLETLLKNRKEGTNGRP